MRTSRNQKIDDQIAQDILDQRPEGCGFDFRAHGDLMHELSERHGVSKSTIGRIWRRQAYTHLKRKGA